MAVMKQTSGITFGPNLRFALDLNCHVSSGYTITTWVMVLLLIMHFHFAMTTNHDQMFFLLSFFDGAA